MALDKIPDTINEINKRAELSVPLLKKIEDCLNVRSTLALLERVT
jgi:hypothetical protein